MICFSPEQSGGGGGTDYDQISADLPVPLSVRRIARSAETPALLFSPVTV